MEEIKNYYKYSIKYYYKQQYKDILEAEMTYTMKGLRENSTISLSMYVPVNKLSARKSLCKLYEVLNIEQKTSVHRLGVNESNIKDIITCHMLWSSIPKIQAHTKRIK